MRFFESDSRKNIFWAAGGFVVLVLFVFSIKDSVTLLKNHAYTQASVAGSQISGTVVSPSTISVTSPQRVAIVDDFSNLEFNGQTLSQPHGLEVYDSYIKACGSNCADPNPILISDLTADPVSNTITTSSLQSAVIKAVQAGATMIILSNTSCGTMDSSGNCSSASLNDAATLSTLQYLEDHNVTLVAAAGNTPAYESNLNTIDTPDVNLYLVGATDPTTGQVASYSSRDADVFVSGVSPNGLIGTSVAAPVFAAMLANALSNNGNNQIQALADVINSPGVLTESETEQYVANHLGESAVANVTSVICNANLTCTVTPPSQSATTGNVSNTTGEATDDSSASADTSDTSQTDTNASSASVPDTNSSSATSNSVISDNSSSANSTTLDDPDDDDAYVGNDTEYQDPTTDTPPDSSQEPDSPDFDEPAYIGGSTFVYSNSDSSQTSANVNDTNDDFDYSGSLGGVGSDGDGASVAPPSHIPTVVTPGGK